MASYSYCFKCSILLREKDFDKGKAFKIGEHVACAACAVGLVPAPAEKPASSAKVRARSTSVRIQAVEAPGAARKRLLVAGAAGAVLVAAALLLLLLPGEGPAAPPPGADPAPAPPPPPSRETAAREALQRLPKSGELRARARALEEFAWAWEGTAASEDARKELAAVREKMRGAAAAALEALDLELAPLVGAGDFGGLFDRLEREAGRFEAPEWTSGLVARRADAEAKARGRLGELAAKAVEHKRKGEAAELEKIVALVDRWKSPSLREALRAELEAVAPPPPAEAPESAEAKAYREAWRAAAAKATARDYAGAAEGLRRAAEGLKDEEVRKEAAADLEDLRALDELHRKMLAAAAKLPPGRAVSFELRGGGRAAGVVARAGRERAELRGARGPVYAEWSEATPAALARLAGVTDPRLPALMALLEGDLEAAKDVALPAKARDYAREAKVPPPPPEEAQARALFAAAEREWMSMETRGAAVEKYATLKDELATTALVRGELDRILRRGAAGREYLITGADARISGTFKRTADGAAVSEKDSDEREAVDNVFEAEFYALPGASYRAWLQVGGCCREVLSFYLQGTEMTASEKGKRVSIEPGGDRAEYVASSVFNLKKEHKDHAKNREPKGPVRWDWIALPLPKYAAPGLKKIRLMTSQQGFGVRHVVVSSLRTSTPKPADLEELIQARAKEVEAVFLDPDLVLHWSFDEASGAFEDATGRFPGAPAGGVGRGPGKIGGAAAFDGASGQVAAADAPELRLAGDLTIAFWMRKESEAGEWARLVGKGTPEKRTYGIWEEPGEGKRILWQIYREEGGAILNHQSTRTVEAGRWHHVACVRRGNAGVIYIDGRRDGEAPCEGAPAQIDAPFTAGYGFHTHYHGAIDDLRVYRRALSDEEIAALFDAAQ